MQINISGHHLEITDALRAYVGDKFSRLERHFDQITSVQVILSPEPKTHKAESTIHISGADVFATAEAVDMYAAIDKLTDKLDQMVDACDNLQGALDPTSQAARRLLEEHTQQQNAIAVGGFFFLRFMVPCITAPESYGLVKELPTPTERKHQTEADKPGREMAAALNGCTAGLF